MNGLLLFIRLYPPEHCRVNFGTTRSPSFTATLSRPLLTGTERLSGRDSVPNLDVVSTVPRGQYRRPLRDPRSRCGLFAPAPATPHLGGTSRRARICRSGERRLHIRFELPPMYPISSMSRLVAGDLGLWRRLSGGSGRARSANFGLWSVTKGCRWLVKISLCSP